MKNFDESIKACPLFAGIDSDSLPRLLQCLGASVKSYAKNEFIYNEGESVTLVGLLLSGSVHILREDFWGRRNILASVAAGDLFGEAFSCAQVKSIPVSVMATKPSRVLFISTQRILKTCNRACEFHTRLINNLLSILANKNIMLTKKLELLAKHTTAKKLLAYLDNLAQESGSNTFTIPFTRQELAEYLCVDRAHMCTELSKLQSEGILTYDKRSFTLKRINPPDSLRT